MNIIKIIKLMLKQKH